MLDMYSSWHIYDFFSAATLLQHRHHKMKKKYLESLLTHIIKITYLTSMYGR